MGIKVQTKIQAPVDVVWRAVTDIANAAEMISGIDKIEVLDTDGAGLVGFRWKETRTLFGKTAEETMTITECVDKSHYVTEARSHGSIYSSRMSVGETNGTTTLVMEFSARPVSFSAKVLWCTLGFLFSGSTKKALQKDLDDIKAFVEGGGNSRKNPDRPVS